MSDETTAAPSKQELAALRSPNREVAASTGLTEGGSMAFSNMEQIMEFGKMMALAGCAIPAHLRDKPGACVAIAIQASAWGMSPFAVAAKTYVVKDIIAYEAQLVNAVILRRAPIVGRFKFSYTGEGTSRRCKVVAALAESEGGDQVEYESPPISKIPVQNSPLWKGDPDQQLAYYSSRAMCRRHFPDVLLGVYTREEIEDGNDIRDVGPGVAPVASRVMSPPKPPIDTVTTAVVEPPAPAGKKGRKAAEKAQEQEQRPEGDAGESSGKAEPPHWSIMLPDKWRGVKVPEGLPFAGHDVETISTDPSEFHKLLDAIPQDYSEIHLAADAAIMAKLERWLVQNKVDEADVLTMLREDGIQMATLMDCPGGNNLRSLNARIRELVSAAKDAKKAKGK